MNMLEDDYYRLALRNNIYHSISSLVYKECGVRLPTRSCCHNCKFSCLYK